MSRTFSHRLQLASLLISGLLLAGSMLVSAKELNYGYSVPPLAVTFKIAGAHYSGAVNGGNLFLQADIPEAPLVCWKSAKLGKLYTLMMLDLDGNAAGSWPDAVPPGENSPVRHWLVGNIPAELLRGSGYLESAADNGATTKDLAVLQAYRAPHIPVVSDRYGFYLFEQPDKIEFAALGGAITNFNYEKFLESYKLGDPVACNYCVAIYTSESPFSGKVFGGNDVSALWHKGLGKGKLAPSR